MKNKHAYFAVVILALLLVFFLSWNPVSAHSTDAETQGSIIYVKPGTNGTCTSWTDACELQTALATAVAGDQIWVAAGTYKPTSETNRTATFQLKTGVAIYGGFPAAGGEWTQRSWVTNLTTLSGDIGNLNDHSDNSYHVVTGSGVDNTAILDGFIIGSGNGETGGGMYNSSGNPNLNNVTFSGNSATNGGGMANYSGSSPTLTDVTFNSNSATNDGGGMYNDSSSPSLSNVTFSSNSASYLGGGMYNYKSSPSLSNVTFSANTATDFGGGMYNYYLSSPTITNAILWGNTPEQIYNNHESSSTVTYSDIQGGYTGTGNINADPLLGSLADNSGFTLTHALGENSPAIDTGDNNNCPNFDQRGYRRPVDGDGDGNPVCDMGSYEYGSSGFTLTVSVFGYGSVTKTPDKIEYLWGEVVTLTPTADADWVFTGWSGDASGMDNPLQITITDDINITANFAYYLSDLTVSVLPELAGTVTVSPDLPTYPTGSQITITAEPNPGWEFTGWSGDVSAMENPLSFTILGDTEIVANFEQVEYTLTVTTAPESIGSVTIDPVQDTYHHGDQVLLTAVGSTDNVFANWSGDASGSVNPLLVTITGNMDITANFNCLLTVTVIPVGGGSVTVFPDQTSFPYGSQVTLTAVPNSGWTFIGWSSDASGIENPLTITIVDNTNITANFTQDEYSLDVIINPYGIGSVTIDPLQETYHYGDVVTLTAAPFVNWAFTSWGGDASGTNNVFTLTVQGNHNVTANFLNPEADILYVIQGTNGTCTSWEDACELQTALFNAVEGNQIWVAAGTYKPTSDNDRTANFQLNTGVAIYGGFPTAGGEWTQRNWETNLTTLSGDIGNLNDHSDNSFHVVTGSEVDGTAVLDGFTISEGNANGSNENSSGGGMFNFGSSPSLSNVTFSGNSATNDGGGMYNDNSSPSLTNVTFSNNTTTGEYGYGGGMSNSSSSPTLTNVTFSDNSGFFGGGMSNSSSSPTLANVTFSGNSSTGSGGGMCNDNSSPSLTNVTFGGNSATYYGGGMYNHNSSPSLTNVTFSGNTASSGGGGMYNHNSSPSLTNVTFGGNSATYYGGGMRNDESSPSLSNVTFSDNTTTGEYGYGGGMSNSSSSPTLTNVTFSDNSGFSGGGMYNNMSSPTLTNVTLSGNSASGGGGGMVNDNSSSPIVTNSILWGNTPDQFSNNYGSSVTITFSDIQGGHAGTGNIGDDIGDDPLLGDLSDNGGFTQTQALGEGSPAIDAGDPSNCPVIDQRGFYRPIDGDENTSATCDMGAYEYASYPEVFTLTVDKEGSGSVAKDPDQTEYHFGEIVSLTVSADPGWSFSGWSGNATGTPNPLTISILNDTSITANFTQDEYTLNVLVDPIDSGSVSVDLPAVTYHYGDTVRLTASPNTGWTFTGWSGDATGIENPLEITVTGNTNITANFSDEYSLVVTVDPANSGTVTVNPEQTVYKYGEEVTHNATAETGYTFSGWTGDVTSTDNPLSVTVESNISVTATFTQNEYSLSVTIDPTGSGSVSLDPPQGPYHYGDIVTLTPSPNPGYSFSSWTGATVTDNKVTITGDTSVIAIFTKDTYGIFLPLILR